MPEDDPEKIWDEYDWERFMQDQDRKTEQYMELLEKYLDDPNRDQIIAQEMGWTHLADPVEGDWIDENEIFLHSENSNQETDISVGFSETFESDPLYAACIALSGELGVALDENPILHEHPAAIRMATHSAIGSARLAAALSDDDLDEIGMTLAYLKRSLRAITLALNACMELRNENVIDASRGTILTQRLFQVRDGVINKMGEVRQEWRHRFGS